jgi:hypothetical protein
VIPAREDKIFLASHDRPYDIRGQHPAYTKLIFGCLECNRRATSAGRELSQNKRGHLLKVTPWHLTKCHLGSGFVWPRRTDFIPNQTTSSAVLLVAPFIKNAPMPCLRELAVFALKRNKMAVLSPARGTTAFSCDTRFGEGRASCTFREGYEFDVGKPG